MIFLVTGAIGTGKTTYVVDELMKINAANLKHIKDGQPDQVRSIYSNIDGLIVPHDPLPDDWRTTPNNSVIVVDECHKIEIYQPNRQALHKDPRITQMNESRHTGHDIYLITQGVKFVHQHVRQLVNQHYHFHNPMGLPASTVFLWRHGNTTTPDSQASKNLAEKTFIYNFKKDVQQNFKSIEDEAKHTRKISIPKKVIFWGLLPFILLAFIAFLYTRQSSQGALDGSYFTKSAEKTTNGLTTLDPTKINTQSPVVYDNLTPGQRADLEARQANNTQQAQPEKNINTISYNVNRPFDVDNSNFRRQVVNYPEFAGCAQFNNTCTCYTQQGTRLQVEPKICQQGLRERPFNYFRQEQQQQYTASNYSTPKPESNNPMQTGAFK